MLNDLSCLNRIILPLLSPECTPGSGLPPSGTPGFSSRPAHGRWYVPGRAGRSADFHRPVSQSSLPCRSRSPNRPRPKVLDMGVIDLVMFSINPGYDYRHGAYAIGSVDERADLRRILGFLDATGGKGRIIAPAAYVIKLLRAHQRKQSDWRLRAGPSGLAAALCSRMSWALTCRHAQFSTTTSGSWNPSDCLLHGSTICATPTLWPPSVPAMTSKRCRAASATLRSPLRWTYTATSTSR